MKKLILYGFSALLVTSVVGCNSSKKVVIPPADEAVGRVAVFNDAVVNAELGVKAVGLIMGADGLRLPVIAPKLLAAGVDADAQGTTFPFIWIANSSEGTISKLDTETGDELARYRTGPGMGATNTPSNPSRTTVDQDGNVWVGNRNGNTITKIGLKEWDQCIDRDGDGEIDTSTGGTDVKDWEGAFNDGQGATGAVDECILQHVELTADGIPTPSNIRLVAIDPDNNIFVGGSSQKSLFKVSNETGEIIDAVETEDTHYGGVVDKDGNLWSMPGSHNSKVQKISSDMATTELIAIGHAGYGVTVDKYGKVWTTELSGKRFSAFDPANPVGTLTVFEQIGHSGAQGITTDNNGDVFIAGNLFWGSKTVGQYEQVFDAVTGAFTGVEFVKNHEVGAGPTGVAVDAVGMVWSANINDNSASRINLETGIVDTFPVGMGPYNYSDMTGSVVRTITKRQGTWEATFEADQDDYDWGKLVWSLKEALPEGTDVKGFVKAANTKIALNAQVYVEVVSAASLVGISGRFLKVKVQLTSDDQESTPVVDEVSVH